MIPRRHFLAAAAAPFLPLAATAAESKPLPKGYRHRIAVATYSFWQFKNRDYRDLFKCFDLAADMGFDAVEILHRQMTAEDDATLQKLKQRAFTNGLAICGFSTHQGFLNPAETVRKQNVDHTIKCIEMAYKLGIPTMRVNTGTVGRQRPGNQVRSLILDARIQVVAVIAVRPAVESAVDDRGHIVRHQVPAEIITLVD